MFRQAHCYFVRLLQDLCSSFSLHLGAVYYWHVRYHVAPFWWASACLLAKVAGVCLLHLVAGVADVVLVGQWFLCVLKSKPFASHNLATGMIIVVTAPVKHVHQRCTGRRLVLLFSRQAPCLIYYTQSFIKTSP
jgi:hypothetical protein